MATSIDPRKIDPASRIFTVLAGDLDFILEDNGLDLDNMDPHLWVAIRAAVANAMSNNWAEVCADAVSMTVATYKK